MAGEFQINLVVSSGINSSVAAKKTVAVRATNAIPIAMAGNDTLSALNKYFKFDGTKSTDADGDLLTYKWVLESAPAGSNTYIMKDDYEKPQCKFDLEGDYVISLVVYDSLDYSEKDTIKVTAKAGYTGNLEFQNKNNKQLNIFPNPSKGMVTVDYYSANNTPAVIEIYSIIGTKLGEIVANASTFGMNHLQISLADFSTNPGIYFIKVTANGVTSITKITTI
jgi:hypothetical protein